MRNMYMQFRPPVLPAIFICGTVLLVGACASQTKNMLPDVPVNIGFDDSNCPTAVDPNTPVTVDKETNQRIVWQAVDKQGNPIDERYEIYFDPFKGRPLHANSKGHLRSPRFDSRTPVGVEYKYTIVGDRCLDKPLDPRFRIR